MLQASSSLLKACSPHLTPAPFSICLILRLNPSWVSQFLFLIVFYYFLRIFQEGEMAENPLFRSFNLFYGYYQLFLKENKIIHDFIQTTLFLFPFSFFRRIFIIFRVIRSEWIFPHHSMNSRSVSTELTVSEDADDYNENKNTDKIFHSYILYICYQIHGGIYEWRPQVFDFIGAGGRSRTDDLLITKYTPWRALLFHILANACKYLHSRNIWRGKAFIYLHIFADTNCTITAQ